MAEGTVMPNESFDAEETAERLRAAMKGLGTDEATIIEVLSNCSNEQRQEIKVKFKTMYGRDLVSDLKSELGGNFEDVVVACMMPPDEYDVRELHKAMKGAGTDDSCLIQIMCSRNNEQIQRINELYKELFQTELESDLIGDTSGHYKRLLVSLSTGARKEDEEVDIGKAQEDAQALLDAGENSMGTDESRFNQILAAESRAHIAAVAAEYNNISEKSLDQAIKEEFSGNVQEGLRAVVKCATDPPAYFAECLYQSMKGFGTDDDTLIRLVVSRSEIDMVQIKDAFFIKYGQTLAKFIKDDCSGDYKRMLLALVK